MVAKGNGGDKFDGDKVVGLTTFAPRRPAAMQPVLEMCGHTTAR